MAKGARKKKERARRKAELEELRRKKVSAWYALRTAPANSSCQQFRFFDLPAELWVKIGRMTIEATNIIITDRPEQWKLENIRQPTPVITRICQKFRAEFLPFYYTTRLSVFVYGAREPAEVLKSWLKLVGEDNTRRLRSFHFVCDTPKPGSTVVSIEEAVLRLTGYTNCIMKQQSKAAVWPYLLGDGHIDGQNDVSSMAFV